MFSGTEVSPGYDSKETLASALTKMLCKEDDKSQIEWRVNEVVSVVF